MKKYLLLLFMLVLVMQTGFAQQIDSIFADMPENIVPGLSETDKSLLLDNTAPKTVPSVFGEIERIAFKDDFLKIRTSEKGVTQLKLLKMDGGDFVICVVKTICAPACDSDIRFFSTDWKELKKEKFLPAVPANSFIEPKDENKTIGDYAWLLPDIYFVNATFIDGLDDLSMKLDLKNHTSADRFAEMEKAFNNNELLLRWNGRTFE